MPVRSVTLLIAASCLLISSSLAVAQQPTRSFVWPLSRSSTPIAPIATTFGPRVDSNGADSYSFHRGIDIPALDGTPVYAIADGEVRLAGTYDNYSTPVVQLRHYKNASRSCKNGGCYYSNYMHLSQVKVTEGKTVRQGELLGYTGTDVDGGPHLHFEIRNGGLYQQNCIHPLTVLPYQNRLAPKVRIDSLQSDENGKGTLTVTLQTARNECDLTRVNVAIVGSGRKKTERTYDMIGLNFAYSPKEDPNRDIHRQDFQNVIARPKPLDDKADYELTLVFYDLPITQDSTYQIKVQAVDARGKSADMSSRLRAEKPDVEDKKAEAVATKPFAAKA